MSSSTSSSYSSASSSSASPLQLLAATERLLRIEFKSATDQMYQASAKWQIANSLSLFIFFTVIYF